MCPCSFLADPRNTLARRRLAFSTIFLAPTFPVRDQGAGVLRKLAAVAVAE